MINSGPSELITIVPITGTNRKIPLHVHIKRGRAGLT